MAIPWASLDITDPAADLAIGFDVANDDSDIYGSRQHIIGWAGTGDNWQDTSKFGTLILSVKKDQGTDNRPDLETDSDPAAPIQAQTLALPVPQERKTQSARPHRRIRQIRQPRIT